ncbi:target of rapamycin complex 2 subunit MAPKAP1-like [Rhopilema esculentum]|uniref:target of rapamycin complex 2 subunit MAPKAP1-like n=1 Tax=Rhopilema esculentum TaxID=499914 RepID=UPI0031D103F7|eukprot:gene2331-17966_t
MTFWDDPETVINHIRHSCVTSDETGMCEMVIVKDDSEIQLKQRRRIGGGFIDETNDYGDYSHSFDIAVSPNMIGRTPRSGRNIDKGKKKNDENQCVNIQWKDKIEDMKDSERQALFKKKSVTQKPHQATSGSLLSQLVGSTSSKPENGFTEYSKFNGEGVEDTCPTHSVQIFLTFASESERDKPVSITVLANVCVRDVIGFVLYKCTAEGKITRAQQDLKSYRLYIAEEDGEVDMDFPALDEKEQMTKFEFQFLALVERHAPAKPKPAPTKQTGDIVVTVNVPGNGFSRVKVDRTDIKMKHILSKMVKKRGLKKAGRKYVLEKQDDLGVPVDMEATLDAMGTFEFRLLREGKKPEKVVKENTEVDSSYVQADLMSFQYKSYKVLMIQNRLLATTEIQLGISGRRIDIDPVNQTKSSKFWNKIKPIYLDMTWLAESEITEEKNGRASFRIHYKKGEELKHYDFEAPRSVADEIVQKINNILDSRLSPIRSDYLAYKQRKINERMAKRH